ncbi:ciliary microtubule inner protein 2B-like [Ascaphus truei]|uniref:ciliary microtubule inner protein 2B-like n=1 Tax=Ascaphus truei TaxID=8439 RepID=UPI003F597A0C
MPIILPQLPETIFSSYDPTYVPGYTGYIPKLRSDIGNIYGNATLNSLHYEPGVPKAPKLPIAGWDDNEGASLSMHFDRRMFTDPKVNTPRGRAENWNITNGYFCSANGKYPLTGRQYMHDGDTHTSSAIQAVENLKSELSKPIQWMSSEIDRHESSTNGLGRDRQTSMSLGKSQQASSNLPSSGKEEMRINSEKRFKERESLPSLYKTNNYHPKRQGKLIYRTDSGLVPNYAGFIPGQMSVIGQTWGKGTVDAIGTQKKQPFHWKSLI